MRKIVLAVLAVLMLALVVGAVAVSAQDATATPVPEPTLTPTPLPPVAFAQPMAEFTGESDNFAGVDPTGQTITYWHQYNSAYQLSVITGLVNAFNANNPYGITVNAISQGGYNDIRTAMNNAIVSGDLPNLVAGFNNDALSYDLDGVVVDLNAYYNDAKWGYAGDMGAELNQNILNGFVYSDGRRLGWVNQVSAEVMVVNNAVLKAAGVDGVDITGLIQGCCLCSLEGWSDWRGRRGSTGLPDYGGFVTIRVLCCGYWWQHFYRWQMGLHQRSGHHCPAILSGYVQRRLCLHPAGKLWQYQ